MIKKTGVSKAYGRARVGAREVLHRAFLTRLDAAKQQDEILGDIRLDLGNRKLQLNQKLADAAYIQKLVSDGVSLAAMGKMQYDKMQTEGAKQDWYDSQTKANSIKPITPTKPINVIGSSYENRWTPGTEDSKWA